MPNDMSPIAGTRTFALTDFLDGHTRAWGVFEDRFGRVRLKLTVHMHGAWSGETFVLREEFHYDDGRHEKRVWQVRPSGDGGFTATCDDCIGEAVGRTGAGTIDMTYRFRLKLKARTLDVHFRDRLIRIDDHRAVNRATMSKWGIRLGELSLFFERDVVRERARPATPNPPGSCSSTG